MRFRFTGTIGERRRSGSSELQRRLKELLEKFGILYDNIFEPNWNSIGIILRNTEQKTKINYKRMEFIEENFTPIFSRNDMTRRTVFCTMLDPALLNTYNETDIFDMLKNQGWKTEKVIILGNRRSFKIIMMEKQQAEQYISEDTAIGGIKIEQESKGIETDTFIKQCWNCGELQPDHVTGNCTKEGRCLKCGEEEHNFFECPIPRQFREMNDRDKKERYCIPCGQKTDHTSLDHSFCPITRALRRKNIRIAREKRENERTEEERQKKIMRKIVTDNVTEWPLLGGKQLIINGIINLAILEEAACPNTFNENLREGLSLNGLPVFEYNILSETVDYHTRKFHENLNIMRGVGG